MKISIKIVITAAIVSAADVHRVCLVPKVNRGRRAYPALKANRGCRVCLVLKANRGRRACLLYTSRCV